MIVVTGSSGFLGSRLVESLVESDRQVLGYDVQDSPDNSVLNFPRMVAVTERFDISAVVHLAGPVLGHVRSDPAFWFDVQIRGTFNAVKLALFRHVPLYLASSFYVYDGISDEWVVNESTPLRADLMEMFGFAKYAAERICQETRNLEWCALRFGSMYGGVGTSNVVDDFLANGEAGEVIEVWGAGARKNQYTHVDDVVDGVMRVIDTQVSGRVVNLINPEVTTIKALATIMAEKYGYTFTFDESRVDPPSMPYMSSNWALEKLEWEPRLISRGLPD